MDSYTQTPLLYYHVEHSSFSNFSDAVSTVVPSSSNKITTQVDEKTCFFRVTVNNSADYSPAAVTSK